jgi:hypothetical protein
MIAAIVACPLWCGLASCHAAHDVATQDVSSPSHAKSNCCRPTSDDKQDQRPGEPVGDGPCQGVCGGAVLERTGTLGHLDQFSLFSPFLTGEVSVELGPSGVAFRCVYRAPTSGGNYGRFVRTLHQSFLC